VIPRSTPVAAAIEVKAELNMTKHDSGTPKAKAEQAKRQKLLIREARHFIGLVATDCVWADRSTPFAATLIMLLKLRARRPELRKALGFRPIPPFDSSEAPPSDNEIPF
jgi:hypothetical protein